MCLASFSFPPPPHKVWATGKAVPRLDALGSNFEKGFNFVVTLCALYHAVLLFLPLLLHALFKHLTTLFNRNIVKLDV